MQMKMEDDAIPTRFVNSRHKTENQRKTRWKFTLEKPQHGKTGKEVREMVV